MNPLALARRLSANLHAVRGTKAHPAHYGVHHGYRQKMKYSRARQFAHKHPMLVRTAGFVAAMGAGLAHAHSTRLPGNVSPAGDGHRYSQKSPT